MHRSSYLPESYAKHSLLTHVCFLASPRHGGRYCLGERKRYDTCNTDACPDDAPSFKDTQCQEFNVKPYKGTLYEWEYVANPSK